MNTRSTKAAVVRGDRLKSDLVRSGELLTAGALAKSLGISVDELKESTSRGLYFTVPVAGRQYFPSFFADQELQSQGLSEVLGALKSESPWAKWLFLCRPKLPLQGQTPIEAIRRGQTGARLLALARGASS